AGLVVSIGTGLAVASGHLIVGLLLLIVSGALDLLDGAVAKASATTTARGAFFDSVSDRVSDSFVLGGVAWYLASARHDHTAVLALAVLAVSFLVSYERARAEALGFEARGGLMERAEYGLYRAGDFVGRVFPTPVATAIARASRPGLARVYRSRQDMTTMARNHLRKAFGPQLSDAALEHEVGRLMDSYARYYMELFLLPSMSPGRIEASTRFEGLEHVRE